MNKRLVWAEIVRIFAIYCIIVLHVLVFPIPQNAPFIFFLGLTLADTCVPLLVILSGALLIGKEESYFTFFRKRVSRVIIPWLTWTCIFTAVSLYFQANLSLGNIIHIFHLIFIPFFWFIVLICTLYLITPALRIFAHAAKIHDILLIVILWFAAVSVLPYIRNTQAFPLHVDNGIVRLVINFIGYFLIGFLITKVKHQKKYIILSAVVFIVSFVVRSYIEYYSVYNDQQLINGSDFIDPGLIIVSTSLFSLFYLLEDVYQQMFNQLTKKALSMISKATLGIYFVHYLFLNRAPLPILLSTTSLIHVSYTTDLFINGFLFFAISFFIIFFLQKISSIKHLVA